ncbi:Glycerol-3-phosphate dehydrogenase (NAD(P)+) [Rubellimicrobium mesophilum DSM 19309]|uniref:Glycerol-3-phosphate dehydrogenase [NAD(P)+] n=1 Tax=Rubellimicrobium mesophilum DSM 19309 TaxID=442562 RepID=A0A017HIN3_9RHOB|nr:NAD(P)H-dependent glycerol-3-phosphate dehydrogenase [Rubellimicrobium mesophilum]EYD74185.1 Glycerol-3-phosphate dehydrogenase (NAD(P)+) [Rubellimicrobium mesophilum DSM 19309]
MSGIVVAGAGAFGTALAVALSGTREVTLWGRDGPAMARLSGTRSNPRLLAVPLPPALDVTSDPAALERADILLLAVPAQALRGFLADHAEALAEKPLVACGKGIDLETLEGPTAVIAHAIPSARPLVLTGPSFAADIARGLPTALTLACADPEEGTRLQALLSTPVLRLYRTTDLVGAELGGALKNVVAIACGACLGGGFGESARAALLTRGFAEMRRLALVCGAEDGTLMGLSGLGDLVLTAMSEGSRNYRYGLHLGRGESFEPGVTVEGAATALAAARLGQRLGIDLPVTDAVAALVEGHIDVGSAVRALLDRPLKAE